MKPFNDYPGGGAVQLGPRRGGNCRHGYGLKLQQMTKQTACAYCGVSLVDDYYHWLMMCVDHVIPTRAGRAIGIPGGMLSDIANIVLACSACNGFGNRFKFRPDERPPSSWEEFVVLRDETFRRRKAQIKELHKKEFEFFLDKPWEHHG